VSKLGREQIADDMFVVQIIVPRLVRDQSLAGEVHAAPYFGVRRILSSHAGDDVLIIRS
jgi:hypothetical protein